MPPALLFGETFLAFYFADDVTPPQRIALYSALDERSRQLRHVPTSDLTIAALTRREARLLGLRARVRHNHDHEIAAFVEWVAPES